MKKLLFFVIIALMLLLISSCAKEDSDTMKAKKIIGYHKTKFDSLPLSGTVANGVREIEIRAFQYNWDPENIVVKKGEKIKLFIASEDAPHGFEIEGFTIPNWNIDKPIIKGKVSVIEFTPNEAGSWEMVCTVYCGPGHNGMKGKFIVRE